MIVAGEMLDKSYSFASGLRFLHAKEMLLESLILFSDACNCFNEFINTMFG
jgi:hypothetical protein